jgi:hypothetical protein
MCTNEEHENDGRQDEPVEPQLPKVHPFTFWDAKQFDLEPAADDESE